MNKKVETTQEVVSNVVEQKQAETTPKTAEKKPAKKGVVKNKITGETVDTTKAKPKKDVDFYSIRLDTRNIGLKDIEFHAKLSNLKDETRFKRGLTFFNYVAIRTEIATQIGKLEDARKRFEGENARADMEEVYDMPEWQELTARLESWKRLDKEMGEKQIAMKFSDKEQEEFKNDNFLKLTASAICRVEVVLPHFSEVITALNEFVPVADAGTGNTKYNAALKKLKAALQAMADLYNTQENDWYHASHLNVNSTMTMQVYKKSYAGCKLKNGEFIPTEANETVISKEIIAQFTGRLQGSISNAK